MLAKMSILWYNATKKRFASHFSFYERKNPIMKKLLLIAILMLALVFTVVACTETPAGTDTTASDTTAETPTEEATTEAPTEEPPTEEVTTEAPTEEVTTEEPTEAPTTEAPTTEEPTEPETVDPMAPANVFEAEDITTLTGQNGIASAEIVDGVLHVVPNSPDPYWYPFASVEGARYVVIRYRTDATGADIQFYIGSTGTGPSDDSTMLRQPAVADGEWHLAIIDTQSLIEAGKYDGATVAYFRFDPLEAGYMLDENGEPYKPDGLNYARYELPEGCSIDIDYVGFFHCVEAAEAYEYARENDPVVLVDSDKLAANAATGNQIASADAVSKNGVKYAHLTAGGGDPYFTVINGAGTMPNYMAIAYRTNTAILGQFFIGSGAGPNGQGDYFNVDWNENAGWTLMVIDITALEVTSITDNNVNYLRFDFFAGDSAEGDYFDVAYIGFFKSETAAQLYFDASIVTPMWDAYKDVISHQSFDELDKYAGGEKVEGVFTPGQSGGWNKVVTLNDSTVDTLRYWGWIAGVTEQGLFGYQINGGAPIYDEAWTHPEDLMAHAPAGSTYTTRMKVMISLEGLQGVNTIRVLYKDAAGNEVCLNEFTVIMPAPAHTDETIVLGVRVNGGPFGAAKNFGQRFTVAEGFLKNITITNMATYADGNANKWNVTIWAWNTDYATTISGEPLYTVNGENHNDNQHFILDVPAGLMISGDIYYEITYLEGSAQFTGWAADGGVAEGVEAYIAGNLAEGTYASSIIVGIPTVEEEPEAPVEPETPVEPEEITNTLDFSAFAPNDSTIGNLSYTDRTNPDGWTATGARIEVSDSDCNGILNGANVIVLNGKTTAIGTLTSPTLQGGISSISFNLAHFWSESKNIDLTLTITGEDGTVITKNILIESPAVDTAYDYVYALETPIQGNFTIAIVNNCPANATSNKDRVAIWNFAWVSASAAETPADNVINVTTTDNYCWVDMIQFTAPASGAYTFTLPAGLGAWDAIKADSDPWGSRPFIDFNEVTDGGSFTVEIAAGATYSFYIGAFTKQDWVITYTFVEGEVGGDEPETPDEPVVEATVIVLGENTINVTEAIYNDGGFEATFTVEVEGEYKFASDALMVRIYNPMGMMLGTGTAYLTAGTYNLQVITAYAPGAGNYKLTVEFTAPEEPGTPDEPEQPTEPGEPDGTAENPYILTEINTEISIVDAHDLYYTYTSETLVKLNVFYTEGCFVSLNEGIEWDKDEGAMMYTIVVFEGQTLILNLWNTTGGGTYTIIGGGK